MHGHRAVRAERGARAVAGRNIHAAGRHALVHAKRQPRVAAPAQQHPLRAVQAEALGGGAVHARARRRVVGGLLQRLGVADGLVAAVHRHVRKANQCAGRAARRARRRRNFPVVPFALFARSCGIRFDGRLGLLAHLRQRHLVKAGQAEEVAQHAQNLPRRPRLPERRGRRVGGLRAPLAIDKSAGAFGERGHRQQHIGADRRVAVKGADARHEIGAAQRVRGGAAVYRVQFRLGRQQQIGAARSLQHRARVVAGCAPVFKRGAAGSAVRQAAGLPGRGAVARREFGQARAADMTNPAGHRAQHGRLGMLVRERAENHRAGRFFAGGKQRLGDRVGMRQLVLPEFRRFRAARNRGRQSLSRGRGDARAHRGQMRGQRGAGDDRAGREVLFVGDRVERADARAGAHRRAQTHRQQRLLLAQVGADQQRGAQCVKLRRRNLRRRKRPRMRVIAKIALLHAVVYVIAAERAREFLQQVILLQRGRIRGKRGDAAIIASIFGGGGRGKSVACVLQRIFPRRFFPRAVAEDHRLGQPPRTVQRLVTVSVAVGEPAIVDFRVVARQHALNAAAQSLHIKVRADAVVRADAAVVLQFPGARGEAVGLGGKRADRAEIYHVAGHFGIHRAPEEGGDVRRLAAPRHAEFHHAGDFLAEAHAARAVNAPRHFGGDQRPDVAARDRALALGEARIVGAVAHRLVLQRALAALVADRAVQRVVDQQKFQRAFLRFARQLRIGERHHALGHRRGAGRQRLRRGLHFLAQKPIAPGRRFLGRAAHLHQAHAAVRRDGQLRVVAKARDVDAGAVGRADQHLARFGLHQLPVDLDGDAHAGSAVFMRALMFRPRRRRLSRGIHARNV